NDFYSLVDNDQPIEVYHRTYFDKGWAKYFMDIDSVLIEGTGIGTSVNDEELKRILSNDIISDIRNEIINAIPIGINSRKLSDNIKLVKSFDSKQALKDKVVRITNPIIINNEIAVFRAIRLFEGPIFILQKKDNKWEVIYAINEWLIFE